MGEVLRIADRGGATTVWVEAVEDDLGARAFVDGSGFVYASHDARGAQVLAEVDPDVINGLYATAPLALPADYRPERCGHRSPTTLLGRSG